MIEEAQGTLSALRARSLKTLEEVSRPVHSTTPRVYQCNVLSWRVSMPAFCRNYLGFQPTVHAHSGSHVARRMSNLAFHPSLSMAESIFICLPSAACVHECGSSIGAVTQINKNLSIYFSSSAHTPVKYHAERHMDIIQLHT